MQNNNLFTYEVYRDLEEIKKLVVINMNDKESSVKKLLVSLSAEGKMLRAIFVLLGGSFGNIQTERIRNIAAAVELLHLASLVHDDIIDEATLRRGKKTLQNSFGVKAALFAGDYLFSQSYVLFSRYTSPKSIAAVSETIKTICKGEIAQFFSGYSFDSTIKDYFSRINGKCASLFSLSLSIGAVEGTAPAAVTHKLKKIGYYTGMAFQLIDDILDITAPDDALGKPAGNDMSQGIYTLPVIYELQNGNEALLSLIKEGNISNAVTILRTSEGLRKAKELSEKYTLKALKLIDELPICDARQSLRGLIEKMLTREY